MPHSPPQERLVALLGVNIMNSKVLRRIECCDFSMIPAARTPVSLILVYVSSTARSARIAGDSPISNRVRRSLARNHGQFQIYRASLPSRVDFFCVHFCLRGLSAHQEHIRARSLSILFRSVETTVPELGQRLTGSSALTRIEDWRDVDGSAPLPMV